MCRFLRNPRSWSNVYAVVMMIVRSIRRKNSRCAILFTMSGTISIWLTVHAVNPSKKTARGSALYIMLSTWQNTAVSWASLRDFPLSSRSCSISSATQ